MSLGIVCENCWRERPPADVFWHASDGAYYCSDVLRCEARFEVRAGRGDFAGWDDSDKLCAHVTRPPAVWEGV